MLQPVPPKLCLALSWALLTFVSLSLRPLFPVDETRYAAVAWEMWQRGDFLVPYLNGEPYSHKPPLLFWLMHLGWWLIGVNDWSLRIVAPLFSLATLYLMPKVAQVLWPERIQVAQLCPFILLGFFFWMAFGTLTMFDIMLSFFVLLGCYALALSICHGYSFKRLLLLGIAIGGGVLTKGPVILLHILPLGLLAPWVINGQSLQINTKSWYLRLSLGVLIGAFIALCWAIPAGIAGGEIYRKAIFLGQTSGRIVDSFAHKLPFWWYLKLLPVLLLPWLLLKPFWQGWVKANKLDFGYRFCLAWIVPVFIAFSLVSGKRIHYLLPLMPALALILAWLLDHACYVNWRRYSIFAAIFFGLLGMAMALLPGLNKYLPAHQEIAALSPLWGLPLLLSAVIVSLLKINTSEEYINTVCQLSIVAALSATGGFFQVHGERFNTAAPAKKIAELMVPNRTIGFFGGKYHGQFHFAGRLTKPITLIPDHAALLAFANKNPTGYVLVEYRDFNVMPMVLVSYDYPFKSHNIGFIPCETLLKNPQLAAKLFPT